MAFCYNCGSKLVDGAKFCSECGTQTKALENERKTVYDGEIHKCPNCGDILDAYEAICETCGYERRDAKATSSVKELSQKLEEIEQKRHIKKDGKNRGVFSLYADIFSGQQLKDQITINPIDEQKTSIIRNFPIPNNKEDLLEFFILASANINLNRYSVFNPTTKSQEVLSDAWLSKFEQTYEKAKLSFCNSQEFLNIQELYNRKIKEIKNKKKEIIYFIALTSGLPLLLIGGSLLIVYL